MKYYAGLIISPWGRKFEWQLEKDKDRLSCEIYEYNEVEAPNKMEAVKILNEKCAFKYKHRGIKTRPFQWENGWW